MAIVLSAPCLSRCDVRCAPGPGDFPASTALPPIFVPIIACAAPLSGQRTLFERMAALSSLLCPSCSEPHPALCRFLGVDPKAVDGSKTIGPSATGGAPSSGGGGGSSSSGAAAAAAPRTFCESSFFFGGASAAGEAAAAGALPEDLNDGLREGIKNGDTQLCLELIKKGADANHRDRQGSYPLHMACLFQRTEVVKALLAAGADIEKQNAAGELPTKIANVTLKMKMLKFKETGNFGLA